MGYLMKEIEALKPEDASTLLRAVLLHLAQVIEDTETQLGDVPDEIEKSR